MIALVSSILGGIGLLTGGAGLVAIPGIAGIFAFFGTAFGRTIGIIVVALSLYAYGYYKGDAAADAQCAAKDLQAQLDAEKRDRNIDKNIADTSQQQVNDLQELNNKLNEQVAGYEKALERERSKNADPKAKPGSAPANCGLSDDWMRRFGK